MFQKKYNVTYLLWVDTSNCSINIKFSNRYANALNSDLECGSRQSQLSCQPEMSNEAHDIIIAFIKSLIGIISTSCLTTLVTKKCINFQKWWLLCWSVVNQRHQLPFLFCTEVHPTGTPDNLNTEQKHWHENCSLTKNKIFHTISVRLQLPW